MSLQAYLLYFMTVLIWGTTWFAIKFQVGEEVNPLASVTYRFAIASALLFIWCLLVRARLRLTLREHVFIALQGLGLFGINCWLVYWSEVYLTTGVVAVIFAMIVFMNIFNGAIFLRYPVTPRVLVGALIGVLGVALLFWPEVSGFGLADGAIRGLLLAIGSTYVASLGTIVATRNASFGLPVISVNAWGMFYGSLTLVVAGLLTGVEFGFPSRPSYTVSLLYLAVIGSVVAFGAYLRLLTMIGPDRASYSSMMTPLVALLISTVFEDYRWTIPAVLGLVLIMGGNLLVMRRSTVAG